MHNRVVTEEDGKKLAEEFGMNFFETSAKININITEVFNQLSSEILKIKNFINILISFSRSFKKAHTKIIS